MGFWWPFKAGNNLYMVFVRYYPGGGSIWAEAIRQCPGILSNGVAEIWLKPQSSTRRRRWSFACITSNTILALNLRLPRISWRLYLQESLATKIAIDERHAHNKKDWEWYQEIGETMTDTKKDNGKGDSRYQEEVCCWQRSVPRNGYLWKDWEEIRYWRGLQLKNWTAGLWPRTMRFFWTKAIGSRFKDRPHSIGLVFRVSWFWQVAKRLRCSELVILTLKILVRKGNRSAQVANKTW